MKKYLWLGLSLFCYLTRGRAADEDLRISPVGERLQVKMADGHSLLIQAGLLLHRESDGKFYKNEYAEIYLVAFYEGRPSIIERFVGFEPTYEVRDINSDGTRELLFFYHTGAHQRVLKIFQVTEDSSNPERLVSVVPTIFSNMGYIKVEGGNILTKNQKLSPDGNSAIVTIDRYHLDGSTLKLIDSQRQKVTE